GFFDGLLATGKVSRSDWPLRTDPFHPPLSLLAPVQINRRFQDEAAMSRVGIQDSDFVIRISAWFFPHFDFRPRRRAPRVRHAPMFQRFSMQKVLVVAGCQSLECL